MDDVGTAQVQLYSTLNLHRDQLLRSVEVLSRAVSKSVPDM